MKTNRKIVAIFAIVAILISVIVPTVLAVDIMSELSLEYNSNIGSRCVYSSENVVNYAELGSGSLPEGLNFYFTSEGVYISGTPTQVGSYMLSIYIEEQPSDGDTIQNNLSLHINITSPVPRDLKVTKSPTSENVTEGEECWFIAAAENYSRVEWKVSNAAGTEIYRDKQIQQYFPGLQASIFRGDDGREYMLLRNIPLAMNGYYVQATFWSEDGTKTENTSERSCLLTVREKNITAPVISRQPQDAESVIGKPVTLEVTATASEGTIKYQWYITRNGKVDGGALIQGATSSTFTPSQTEGSCQYFCVLYSINGDKISENGTTRIATVKYTKAGTTVNITPAPTTVTPTPSAAVVTPVPTAYVTPEPIVNVQKNDHTVAYIIGAVLICAMICGTVLYLDMSKKRRRRSKSR